MALLDSTRCDELACAATNNESQGLGTNLIRTVPTAAVTLTTYELIQRFLKKPK